MQSPSFLREHHDISVLSAFKTPARARYFFDITDASDIEKLSDIVAFSKASNLPYIILGAGTNCLFAFDEYDGIIIRNRYSGWEEPWERDGKRLVRIHSGQLSHFVAQKLYDFYQVSTLIPWIGLPGTFGGATIGNAGCFGVEMSDIFVEATVLDLSDMRQKIITHEEMQFSYRHTALKGDSRYIVLSTLICIDPLGGEYETYTPDNLKSIRKVKQPAGFSCGSFFTNTLPTREQRDTLSEFLTPMETLASGRLIDRAGLKGARVGGVKVSEQHGNFFINDAKATWQDVLTLRDLVKKTVFEKYGVELHEEVRIIQGL